MYFLIKKAVAIRKHLERNRKDRDSKFRLIMVESRIHRLTRYYKRTAPSWCKSTSEEVEASVCRLAKKGLTPSQIGVLLRDQKGIGQVKAVTGSKILRLLKKNGKVSAFRS